MKKTQEVLKAELVLEAARQVCKELEAKLSQANAEVANASVALRAAMVEADKHLPRCKMVSFDRYRSRRTDADVVIVRQTPTGILVVRKPGEDVETRFEWSKLNGRSYEKRKAPAWGSARMQLEDVPGTFTPKQGEVMR